MAKRTSVELRSIAEHYRKMSADGDDPELQASLLLVAEEFEQEADRADASKGKPAAGLADVRDHRS